MKMCQIISDKSGQLVDHFNNVDGTRAAELAAISGPDEFSEFYARLKSIRERHRKSPGEIAEPIRTHVITAEVGITAQAFQTLSRL